MAVRPSTFFWAALWQAICIVGCRGLCGAQENACRPVLVGSGRVTSAGVQMRMFSVADVVGDAEHRTLGQSHGRPGNSGRSGRVFLLRPLPTRHDQVGSALLLKMDIFVALGQYSAELLPPRVNETSYSRGTVRY